MATDETDGAVRPWLPVVGRGVGLFAIGGLVLGGLAGTVDWPLVGTLFGAVAGAAAGAVVGGVDALLLLAAGAGNRPRWVGRLASGTVGLLAVPAAARYGGPIAVPDWVVVAATVVGAVFAAAIVPLILTGARGTDGKPAIGSAGSSLIARFLGWGIGGGAAIGAVAGLVIGLIGYPPTALFALVEGGVFGTASGAVLAFLALGVGVLPRLIADR